MDVGSTFIFHDITVYHDDCLSLKHRIEDHSIDACIIDPPYFLDQLNDNWDKGLIEKKARKGRVVKSLPVGMKFDKKQGEKLQTFIRNVSLLIHSKLKDGAFYLCFSQPRLAHRMAIGIEEAGFEIRDIIAWKRPSQGKAFSLNHMVNKRKDLSPEQKVDIIESMKGFKVPMLKCDYESVILARKIFAGTYLDNFIKNKAGLMYMNGHHPSNFMEVRKPFGVERMFNHMTLKPIELIKELLYYF